MATNTYVALDKVTVGTATPSVTINMGSTISSAYTDLVIVVDSAVTTALASSFVQFNGDTGSNYSSTWIYGDGSSATSTRYSSATAMRCFLAPATASGRRTMILNVQNYSNSTTYKTVIGRNGNASDVAGAFTGLWRSTAAITSITFTNGGGYNFDAGSTFSLYGIKAEVGESTPKATGGVVTSDATYWYHTFTSTGNFVPNQSLSCDYLVVAGGGGSGSQIVSYNAATGGGGAGGLRSTVGATGGGGSLETALSLTAQNYMVLIGAGGAGAGSGAASNGNNGSDTTFATITAAGGGGGGRGSNSSSNNGLTGGSGGGGGGNNGSGGSGTANQGFGGGTGTSSTLNSGGGGGAGSAGTNGGSIGGNGGAGVAISTLATPTGTGVSNYYAGGGAGGGFGGAAAGTGGAGGGGNGGTATGTAGTAYTGGGAGGSGSGLPGSGASGGSGIVIVRYAKV